MASPGIPACTVPGPVHRLQRVHTHRHRREAPVKPEPGAPAFLPDNEIPAGGSVADAHEGWLGLPIASYQLPAHGEFARVYLPEPILAVGRAGSAKLWYSVGTRRHDLYAAPRVTELLGSGYEVDRGGWRGMARGGIAVRFPPDIVNRLLHVDGPPFDLSTRHEVVDGRVADLVYALGDEASSGSPCGALYVEGLTLALIGLLSAEHGARRVPLVSRTGRFSARERALLREFVVSHLGEDLGIERLAALVRASPAHFSRVFKTTFGQSPHAYVVEQRLQAACQALRREPDRSIADIASGTGFSSQSHFTAVFRQRIGATPARWRRGG